MQPADGLRNIAQRVAADIAVGRGIRRFADADAVQNDDDDSLNLHSFALQSNCGFQGDFDHGMQSGLTING